MNDQEVVRAILAGIAMHGLISSDGYTLSSIPRTAVQLADTLLDELEYSDDPLDNLGVASIKNPRRKSL